MSFMGIFGVVLVLSSIVLVLFFEVRFFILFLRKKPRPASRLTRVIHVFFVVGLVAAAYAFFIEPFWLQVTNVDIVTDKLQKTEFTLVQISDFHCDKKQRNEERVVRLVNEINPDIIAFTGDSINTPEALPVFKSVLNRLKAKMGKVAVKGNWDAWFWRGMDIVGGTGFSEINGEAETFLKNGEALTVVGLDPGKPVEASDIFRLVSPKTYNVFLFHYPGINKEIGNAPYDLILSGHTHGGQVALPFYGAVITMSKYGKKYESGAYPLPGGKMLYVSRGVGMEGGMAPRVRFLSRPEITVFHIKPKKTAGNNS